MSSIRVLCLLRFQTDVITWKRGNVSVRMTSKSITVWFYMYVTARGDTPLHAHAGCTITRADCHCFLGTELLRMLLRVARRETNGPTGHDIAPRQLLGAES